METPSRSWPTAVTGSFPATDLSSSRGGGGRKRSVLPSFLRRTSSSAVGRKRAGGSARAALSGNGQTSAASAPRADEPIDELEQTVGQVTSTKAGENKPPPAHTKPTPSRKTSWLGLRRSSSIAGKGKGKGKKKGKASNSNHTRRLGGLIESRAWDGVREELCCRDTTDAGAVEAEDQPNDGNDEDERGKEYQRQHVAACLDSLIDFTGQNALHHLCRFQPPVDIISYIIDFCPGLSVDLDCLDRTPLHMAAGWGSHPDVIIALLEAGHRQLTAVEGGSNNSDSTRELLLECLKRVASQPDMHGKTPLHFAAENFSTQVSRSHSMFSPSFATTHSDGKNCKLAKDALRVVKVLADACPDAVDCEDIDGMTPSDYVLRGGGYSRLSLKGGAEEAEMRRKAVRYLVQARGRKKARLRVPWCQTGDCNSSCVNTSKSSADKSANKKKQSSEVLRGGRAPAAIKEEDREDAERREDTELAARLLDLMGGGGGDDHEANEMDEKSLERLQQLLSDGRKTRGACLGVSPGDCGQQVRCSQSASAPPLGEIEVPIGPEGEDDGISALTPPANVPEADWKEEKARSLTRADRQDGQ